MSRSVDLVVSGRATAALAAAIAALRRGERVLVVLRSADARVAARLRRHLAAASACRGDRLTVMRRARVVCVDGVDEVEAVVVRHLATGRLTAINTRACAVVRRDGGVSQMSWKPRVDDPARP